MPNCNIADSLPKAGEIRLIQADSIHRIVAGQAVNDLAGAVKELVDNALDAGSKIINIRLFNQGIDIVEVSDDGCGIPVSSRPFVALPHATSKIKNVEDLYDCQRSLTLGFRGEALFSLANLSESLVVSTRTADEPLAQKLVYRRDGSLDESSVVSMVRKFGTTVAVVRLLDALPVRRHDMVRHIGRHRRKLIKWMEGYALFSLGVGIHLMDIIMSPGMSEPREQTLLATPSSTRTLADTIAAILGSKFLSTLCPVDIDLSAAVAQQQGTASADVSASTSKVPSRLTGYISRALGSRQDRTGPNQGSRSRQGEQFFCINGRPVELPSVARLLNEIWKSTFGQSSNPSCVLQFQLPNGEVDVNLSPDKREVLLTHQAELAELVRTAITQIWSSHTQGHFIASMAINLQTLQGTREEPDGMESPGRFNRRYAFSHDFRKMKLQHEYDDGREKSRSSQTENNDALDVSEEILLPDDLPQVTRDAKTISSGSLVDEERKSEHKDQTETLPLLICKRLQPKSALDDVTTNGHDFKRFIHSATSPPASAKERIPSGSDRLLRNSSECEIDLEAKKLEDVNRRVSSMSETSLSERLLWRETVTRFNTPGCVSLPEDTLRGDRQEKRRSSALVSTDGTVQEDESSEGSPRIRNLGVGLERYDFRVNVSGERGTSTLESNPQLGTIQETGRLLKRPSRLVSIQNSGSPPEASESPDDRERDRNDVDFEDTEPPEKEERNRDDVDFEDMEQGGDDSDKEERCEHVGPPTVAPATVAWDEFETTSVLLEARRERLALQSRKRSFAEISSTHQDNRVTDAMADKDREVEANKTTVRLSKTDFKGMRVIGQFNMGFILTCDESNNLWIMDQHACDEKYQFEKMCAETTIQSQPLICPLPLELSPAEETCVLENLDIFAKNGFRFDYDETKPARHRLALKALPHSGAREGSKAVQFSKEDVSALCAMLGGNDDEATAGYATVTGTGADGTGLYGNNAVRRYAASVAAPKIGNIDSSSQKLIARLPRAVAMFASRACRNSVMIGTALSTREMERIIERLAELEQPWNCPHGRPTLRHAGYMRSIMIADTKGEAEHLAGPTVTLLTQEETAGTPA